MSVENKDSLTSMEDTTSIDKLDLNKLTLMRGQTPEDITEKCLKLCRDYLVGDWKEQTINTIQVKRVSGGLTNQLYHCAITTPNLSSKTPQEVAIRLFGPRYWNPTGTEGNERLPDIIVASIVSQNKLGPHVYGLFEGGQIFKYYKHRQFVREDQGNDKLVRQVFEKLARIHALEVPIKRTKTNWLFTYVEDSYDKIFKDPALRVELEKYDCKTLLENDIKPEIEWWRSHIEKVCANTEVFTHNDYRSSNLLITEPDDEIVVCDFESFCYGYRGLDFVYLWIGWGQDQWNFTPNITELADEETFAPMLQIYLEESERLYGKEWSTNPVNTVQHIFKEIIISSLSLRMFDIMLMSGNFEDKEDRLPLPRKVCLEYADADFKWYLTMKQKLIDGKVIS